ncbi:MAG: response regulator [Armatimonadota bacterium]
MCKILVVDDEEAVRAAIQRRLERDGNKVETAACHEEAVEKISSAEPPYDIVLTDMVMENPDSGLSVLRAALTQDVFTEVVVLTAYGNVTNAVECMKHGAFDYVQKNMPGIDVYDEVARKVNQAMERRRQALGTVRRMEWFAHTYGD